MKKSYSSVAVMGLALAIVAIGTANAAPLTVASYDMLNGDAGSYTYYDDTYAGTTPAANDMIAHSVLAGGKGQLTDGVVATQNWYNNPQPYVGWNFYDPKITFHFGSNVTINSVTFSFDDSNGAGGVSPPASVDIGTTNYVVTGAHGGSPFDFTVSGLSLFGNSIDVKLNRGNQWVFASEISFNGVGPNDVPEPESLVLLGLGLGALLLARGRKKA